MSASLEATSKGDLTEPATPSSSGSREWLGALRYCAAVYLAVRTALFLLSATAWGLSGSSELVGRSNPAPMVHAGWLNTINGWIKLDSGYFISVARSGYQSQSPTAAFFPATRP